MVFGESRPAETSKEEIAYVEFQQTAARCLEALEGDSSRWFPRLYKVLLKERDRVAALPEDQRALLQDELSEAILLVTEWARPDGIKKSLEARRAETSFSVLQERIHDLEHVFAIPNRETPPFAIEKKSPEELARLLPDQLEYVEGKEGPVMRFRAEKGDDWTEVLVPQRNDLFYKGGLPRILLKLFAGASPSLLRAEIPMNDIDMIAWPKEGNNAEIIEEGLRLGADLEGIEMVENPSIDEAMKVRDVDLNQCFFGKEGLVFSENALRAMQTGTLNIMDPRERGLYGSESYYFEGMKLVKNRGLYRLFKFVVEGKAEAFEQVKLNRGVDLGIYWLVLARKFAKKSNAGALLNRFYEIGNRAGQVQEGENTIYDVLTRVHQQYPFFTFTDQKQSEEDIVRWLSRKLAKVANRQFRLTRGVASGAPHERFEGDSESERISLAGYVDDAANDVKTAAEWESFVQKLQTESMAA